MPRTQPVEVFTTNYDTLIETALEAERVPSFDGFVGCHQPFFLHESLARPESAPGSSWTRLWKIHGSINWHIEVVKGRPRVVRTGAASEGEMILPSHHKYDELESNRILRFWNGLRKCWIVTTRYYLYPDTASATNTLTRSFSTPSKQSDAPMLSRFSLTSRGGHDAG